MNILFLRIGRLGDMVMILPAIQEILKQYPQATLYAITSIDGKRLLTNVGIKKERLIIYRNRLFFRFFDAWKIKKFIKNTSFEHVFCFESKKRSVSWLPRQAKTIKNTRATEHYANRCLALVTSNPYPWRLTPYLPLKAEEEQTVNQLLNRYEINQKTCLIGLHPTYSGLGKWGKKKEQHHRLWPWQNFSKLATTISQYAKENGMDIKIVMNLLPSEHQLGLNIQRESGNQIILLPPQLHFQRYLHYLNRLNILITPNTGVMHLAAALKTPLVALFSGFDPADCGPYMADDKFVVLRAEDTPHPASGLASISVGKVLDSTLTLLDAIKNDR